MKPATLLALPLLCAATVAAQPARANDPAIQKIRTQLDKTIIPSFKVANATLPEVIALMMEKAKEADPKWKPVRIAIDPELLKPETIFDPQTIKQSKVSPLQEVRITVNVVNIPESMLLQYVSGLCGLDYRITATKVEIDGCDDAPQRLITRRYSSPGILFDAKMADDAKCQAELANDGIQFPKGSFARCDAAKKVLTVRDTEENLELVDQVVQTWFDAARARK